MLHNSARANDFVRPEHTSTLGSSEVMSETSFGVVPFVIPVHDN
jgi:hypothetical protein